MHHMQVDQAITRLKHHEVVGMVQHGTTGIGWRTPYKPWSRASREKRKWLVITEVRKEEEEGYKIMAGYGPIPARQMDNLGGCHQQDYQVV